MKETISTFLALFALIAALLCTAYADEKEAYTITYEEWIQIEVGDIATYHEDGSMTFSYLSE